MDKVATLPNKDRADLFSEAAATTGFPAGLLEKDFWVCWSLKHLFSIEEFAGHLMFKGGTSLSKVFNAIHRFSEDLDLAVDWRLIGIGEDQPGVGLSKNQRDKLWKKMEADCRDYIAGPFQTALMDRFVSVLGAPEDWKLAVDPRHPDNLVFQYPVTVPEQVGYLKAPILLELGTLAAFTPSDQYTVTPMVATNFADIFYDAVCPVRAVNAERTFWEKATILHREFHRDANRPLDDGYSRHYYDLAMLAANAKLKAVVVGDTDLLAEVVAHKQHFYPQAWAMYETAVPGSLKLQPSAIWTDELRADYAAMQIMMYPDSEPPTFDQIVETLIALEDEINCGP